MDEENITLLTEENKDELVLCVRRGSGDNIDNYIMKPGEMAFDKTNCVLKVNNSNEEVKFSEVFAVNTPIINGKPVGPPSEDDPPIETVMTAEQLKKGTNYFTIGEEGPKFNNYSIPTINKSADGSIALQDSLGISARYLRAGTEGILPYSSNGTIGTSSLPFFTGYINEINGTLHGKIIDTERKNSSWINGRDYSLIYKRMPEGATTGTYIPMATVDGVEGAWTIGSIGDVFSITYAPNNNYNTNNNDGYTNFHFYKDGSTSFASSVSGAYLPLSGGTMNAGAGIYFPSSEASLSVSTPMSIAFGTIACLGTLRINADTDNTGAEHVLLTAGKGLSSTLTDGLAIGQSTLRWQGNDVIHSGNIGSQTVGQSKSVYGEYTGNGGAQGPSYIGACNVRFNMMNEFTGVTGFGSYADVMMMNTYGWWDVPYATALAIQKNGGTPRAWIASGGNSSTWGGVTELVTGYNIGEYTGGYKVCAGTIDIPTYSTKGSLGSNSYADVSVSVTWPISLPNPGSWWVNISVGYNDDMPEGILDIYPYSWDSAGMYLIRIIRSTSGSSIPGFKAYYTVISK